jgi:hypothetical protein
MAFWWCIAHNSVEGSASDDTGCANLDRLGPYETREQASRALESTRARTAAEDARDEADNDWGSR